MSCTCNCSAQLATQTAEIKALEERIENLNDLAVIAEGRIATQTERVRLLTEALERIVEIGDSQFGYYYVDVAKQALQNTKDYK